MQKVEWHLPMDQGKGKNEVVIQWTVSVALQDGKVLEIIKMSTERGMTI